MKLFFLLSIVISVCLGEGNTVYIRSISDFISFYVNVSNGNNYSSSTIYLNSPLNFDMVETFNPIGTRGNPFSGTFDGQGYVIKNLKIDSSEKYVGLFGYTEDATIKNVILDESCTITSSSTDDIYIGSICGICNGSCTISGNINKGSVTYTGGGNSYIGGIVGYCSGKENEMPVIVGNMNYRTVTYAGMGNSIWIGGIAGYSNEGLTIQGCVNYGSITVNGICKSFYAGGVTGELHEDLIVQDCHNFGNIYSNCTVSNKGYIGGVTGTNSNPNNKITGCISDGAIENTGSTVFIGGICGNISIGIDIFDCYYNKSICGTSAPCADVGSIQTPSYDENYIISGTGESLFEKIGSTNNNVIKNVNGATLTLKVNCEVIATLSSKLIVLPSSLASSQWYSDPECSNIFIAAEITEDIMLYQKSNSHSGTCDYSSSQFTSSSVSVSSISTSLPHSSSLLLPSFSFSSSTKNQKFVQIIFNKKDLTDEEVDKVIHEITRDNNYIIEEIKIEDGKLIAIIKFDDVEAATNFVETIKIKGNESIEGASFINEGIISFSSPLIIYKIFLYFLFFVSFF